MQMARHSRYPLSSCCGQFSIAPALVNASRKKGLRIDRNDGRDDDREHDNIRKIDGSRRACAGVVYPGEEKLLVCRSWIRGRWLLVEATVPSPGASILRTTGYIAEPFYRNCRISSPAAANPSPSPPSRARPAAIGDLLPSVLGSSVARISEQVSQSALVNILRNLTHSFLPPLRPFLILLRLPGVTCESSIVLLGRFFAREKNGSTWENVGKRITQRISFTENSFSFERKLEAGQGWRCQQTTADII